jgi:hypothetical protein
VIAGAPRPRWQRLRRRRTVIVALVVVAALIVLFATPAFGLIRDLIGRKDVPFSTAKPAPAVVKKRFYDLALGAPGGLRPEAIAGKAREVGVFRIDGRPHRLWVAPTRHGGYCYEFERWFGGCRAETSERKTALLGVTFSTLSRAKMQIVRAIGGDITSPAADAIRIDYADGAHSVVPFVYVSKPIGAGFFAWVIPAAHRLPGTQATAAVLLDSKRHVLARQPFRFPRVGRVPRPHRLPVRRPRLPILSSAASVRLRPPLQEATAGGVTATAGKNGNVHFQIGDLPATVRRLVAGHGVSYDCFRLTREFGIFTVRSLGSWGRLSLSVGLRLGSVGTPFDGCELQGSYGHIWPDVLQSHSAAEIAFTPAGRRFFADRAAARDLALFVRSRRMHTIRKLAGSRLVGELYAAYGDRITRLRSLGEEPGASRIGYLPTADGVIFVERSLTGRRFTVTIRNGKIKRQNLKPYAFVF